VSAKIIEVWMPLHHDPPPRSKPPKIIQKTIKCFAYTRWNKTWYIKHLVKIVFLCAKHHHILIFQVQDIKLFQNADKNIISKLENSIFKIKYKDGAYLRFNSIVNDKTDMFCDNN